MKRILLALSFTTTVFGQNLQFKDVVLTGSGCPKGTTSLIKSPNNQTLTVLFDQFIAEVPQFTGENENENIGAGRFDKTRNYKICYINIGTNIPLGYKVEAINVSVDFRGMSMADPGAMTLFGSSITDFNGLSSRSRGKSVIAARMFKDQQNDLFVSKTKSVSINSGCSSANNNYFKISIQNIIGAIIQRGVNPDKTSAYIALDSADMTGKMKVRLKLLTCDFHKSPSPTRRRSYAPKRPRSPRRNPRFSPRVPPRSPRNPQNPRSPYYPHYY